MFGSEAALPFGARGPEGHTRLADAASVYKYIIVDISAAAIR